MGILCHYEANMKLYHKKILYIAFPSILSNITVPLLGLIDLTIAGHLGSASYIGAVSIGGTIFNMIYWIFAFLRMGTSGMTSQAYGAGQMTEVRMLLQRSLASSLAIALLILILQDLLLYFALSAMSPPESIAAQVTVYFKICVWGAPAVLGLYSLTGWFIGLQNARYPLYVAIVQNLINIAASLFLVFILQMDIAGIALGTLIAQYGGFILSLGFCTYMHRKLDLSFSFSWSKICRKNDIRRFFFVNRDIFLRTLCLVGVTLYFTSAGSRQGEKILAANALLMQYFTLYSYFMDGFAFAGEALAGNCAGADDRNGLKNVIRSLFIWGYGVAILFTSIYIIGGKTFLGWLTDESSVVETAISYLPWAVLIPFAGLSAFIWDGVFIGLTATRYMLLSMACAAIIFFMMFFIFQSVWHNHALWMSFLLYLWMRGVVQRWFYKNKILSLPQTK